MAFRVLTVCTGNICRSPQAEQLLRAGFAASTPHADVHFSSAGTMALVGSRMPEQAALLSAEFGGDPKSHVARQLSPEMIDQADLVLTMAREHRGAVARLVPRAARRTFTLLEFARIVEGISAARHETNDSNLPESLDFPAWLTLATERRGYFTAAAELDDVIDPYRRSDETYRFSVEQIAPAVTEIVGKLGTQAR